MNPNDVPRVVEEPSALPTGYKVKKKFYDYGSSSESMPSSGDEQDPVFPLVAPPATPEISPTQAPLAPEISLTPAMPASPPMPQPLSHPNSVAGSRLSQRSQAGSHRPPSRPQSQAGSAAPSQSRLSVRISPKTPTPSAPVPRNTADYKALATSELAAMFGHLPAMPTVKTPPPPLNPFRESLVSNRSIPRPRSMSMPAVDQRSEGTISESQTSGASELEAAEARADELQAKLDEALKTIDGRVNAAVDTTLTVAEKKVLEKRVENLERELESAAQAFTQLEQEKASLQKANEELSQNIEQGKAVFDEKVGQLEAENSALKRQATVRMQSGTPSLLRGDSLTSASNEEGDKKTQRELQRALRRAHDAETRLQEQTENIAKNEEAIKHLEGAIGALSSLNQATNKQKDDLEQKLTACEAVLAETQEASAEHEKLVAELQESLRSATAQLADSGDELSEAQNEIQKLNDQLVRRKNVMDNFMAKSEEQFSKAREEKEMVEQDLENAQQRVDELETQLVRRKSVMDNFMSKSEEQFAKARQENDLTEAELNNAKVQIEDLEAQLTHRKSVMNNFMSKSEEQFQKAREENEALKQELEQAAQFVEGQNVSLNELDSAKTQIEQLQGQLQRMVPEEEHAAIEQQLSQTVNELEDQRQLYENLQEELSNAQKDMAGFRQELDHKSQELDNAATAFTELQNDLSQARISGNPSQLRENEALKGTIATLQKSLEEARQASQSRTYSSEQEVSSLRAQVRSYQRQINESQRSPVGGPADQDELDRFRKDLERRARTVDNALRLQEIAEKRCEVIQQRLNEEMDRQRGLAGHMRETLEHFDKTSAEREPIEEPYWSTNHVAGSPNPQFAWPKPEDFPILEDYVDALTGQRNSVKSAKKL